MGTCCLTFVYLFVNCGKKYCLEFWNGSHPLDFFLHNFFLLSLGSWNIFRRGYETFVDDERHLVYGRLKLDVELAVDSK